MTENAAKALTILYETWKTPDPSLVGKLPRKQGGSTIYLDYLGHAEVTRALIEADPEWSWEPMAVNEQGLPVYRIYEDSYSNKMAELWIKLSVLGSTIPGVGTCRADKPDLPKELISDALRNAAMRRGVALSLWSKQEWADVGAHSAEPGIKRNSNEGNAAGVTEVVIPDPLGPVSHPSIEKALNIVQDAFGEGTTIENYEDYEDQGAPFEPPPSTAPRSPAPESDRPQPAGAGTNFDPDLPSRQRTGAGTISEPQKKKISVMLANLGVTDADDRHNVIGTLLGLPPRQLHSLDKREASTVIDGLGKLTADDFVEVGGSIQLV